VKRLLAAAFALVTIGGVLYAQNPAVPPATGSSSKAGDESTQSSGQRITVRVNLVNVLFTATDKKGREDLDLGKNDFRIFEDNHPQTIRFFSRETDLPLRIGILIDTSNSVREHLRFEQEAAIEFLNDTIQPGRDQAFLVGFDVESQMLQDYTDNVDKLSDAIRSLRAGGVTALYDSIYSACQQKMLVFPPPEPYLRRVLIVVSDGNDNSSEHSRDEALSMAERAEATIYAIGTNLAGSDTRGDKVLKFLAEQTGGRAFFPFEANDVAASSDERAAGYLTDNFKDISRELRTQYSLAYVSTNQAHDGTFRRIQIEPLDKKLHIRAKSGYFAPTQ
jgi:VWFA-related protein